MGIKGLNQLLKRICETEHISIVPIRNFADKKIAIDATLYVCAFKMRNNYVESIIDFLTILRQNRIRPIFIFDGTAPEEKKIERIERTGKREAARIRIKSLERDLEIFQSTGEMSELLKSIDFKSRRLVPLKISVTRIREYIDKLKSQILNLEPKDFETMKSLLKCFDIPFVTASGEGEFLCAALARHGMVDAVMSTDTDTLACLSPRVINRLDGEYFHVISLEKILHFLKITEKEFVDLCIMCGTDFNVNIPRIGPITSYELISKYKSINVIANKLDVSLLKYERVREIFSYSDKVPEINIPECEGIVNFIELKKWTENIESIKKRLNV